MKEQIIQLEPHDDIHSARDKLAWARAPRVLLVYPGNGHHVLERRLDLVLLQREATRRGTQLALISRDPHVVENARELGIAVFPSIQESHRVLWRTAHARLDLPAERPTPIEPALAEAGARFGEGEESAVPPRLRPALTAVTFGVTLAILLTLAFLALPGATIHLAPASNQVAATTTITADPNALLEDMDTAAGLIPARMVGVEVGGSTSVDVSGTVLVPSEKARGIVMFTNRIPEQVNIPAGTVVRTSAARPVRFVTLADVTLPGTVGDTVEVAVEAIEAGFEGNVPAGRVNELEGPLNARVIAANPEPTRGGLAADVRAISAEDMERARALLLQQLQQRAYGEMQSDLLEDFEFVPLESLNVVLVHTETFSGYEGQAADRLSLSMRVTVQGVAVDERLARQVVYAELAGKVGPGYQISADSLIFRQGEVISFGEDGRVTFVMQGAGDVFAAVDVRTVRSLVRGVPLRRAAERLEQELLLASPPEIQPWPEFWPLMPALPVRISVDVEGGL